MFDKALYLKVFAVLSGMSVVGLILSYFYFGSITVTDTIGTMISTSIVAFMVQLYLIMKRQEQ